MKREGKNWDKDFIKTFKLCDDLRKLGFIPKVSLDYEKDPRFLLIIKKSKRSLFKDSSKIKFTLETR